MGLISLSQALVPGPGVNLDTRVPLQVVQADPGSLTVAHPYKTLNSMHHMKSHM